jgi:hypothetical protein
MKTPVQIAAEIISDMPTGALSAKSLKEIIVDFLTQDVAGTEKEHLTLAFKEGQSRPLQLHTEWFGKRYGQIERAGEGE